MTESGQQQWTVSWVTEEDDEDDEEEEASVPHFNPGNEMIFGVASDCIQLPQQTQDAHEVVMTDALTELKPIITGITGGGGGGPVYLDDPHNLATAHHEVVVEAPDVGGEVVADDVTTQLITEEVVTGDMVGASETVGDVVIDQHSEQFTYQDPEFFGVQVTEEEVISEVWDNGQPGEDGQ